MCVFFLNNFYTIFSVFPQILDLFSLKQDNLPDKENVVKYLENF